MGKGEKIFWFSIAVLAGAWLVLYGLASRNQNTHILDNEPILKTITKRIIEIVDDNKSIRNTLENPKTVKLLHESLHLSIADLNASIAYQVNQAFSPVSNNIDSFLNFHYSVIGEYTELVGAVSNEMEQIIKTKLFGEVFENNMEMLNERVNQDYIKALKKHLDTIDDLATKDMNKTLNSEILSQLHKDIEERTSVQIIKLSSIIAGTTAVKIIAIISAKIIAKTATKLAAKSALKTSAKIVASSTAGTAGLGCGPLAWVCSPVAATVAWFGTDAIIISADEYMNREEFKEELIAMIDIEKKAIIEKLQTSYSHQFEKNSLFIEESFKNTIIKKQVEKIITVKEKIFK